VILNVLYDLNLQSLMTAFCVKRLPVSRLCKLIVFLFGSFLVGDNAHPPTKQNPYFGCLTIEPRLKPTLIVPPYLGRA
jgi:hypothetical protein